MEIEEFEKQAESQKVANKTAADLGLCHRIPGFGKVEIDGAVHDTKDWDEDTKRAWVRSGDSVAEGRRLQRTTQRVPLDARVGGTVKLYPPDPVMRFHGMGAVREDG